MLFFSFNITYILSISKAININIKQNNWKLLNILRAIELSDSNFVNAFIKLLLITLYDNSHNDDAIADTISIPINNATVFLL